MQNYVTIVKESVDKPGRLCYNFYIFYGGAI